MFRSNPWARARMIYVDEFSFLFKYLEINICYHAKVSAHPPNGHCH